MNIVGSMEITDSVVDFNTSPELDGAAGVKTVSIDGTTYVYVTGRNDNGIQIFTMDSDGMLDPIGSFADSTSTFMDGPTYLDVATVGNNIFLVVPARDEDGLTTLQITTSGPNKGLLTDADTIQNGGGDFLDYADQVETFSTPNGTFVAVTANFSNAVSIYSISNNGTLSQVDVELDTADVDNRLDGVTGLSITDIGNKTFLYVGSQDENAVTVYELNNNGTMDFATTLSVGAIDLNGIEAASFNGQDYLILTDSFNGEFEIFTIGSDGVPVFASTFDAYVESGSLTYDNFFVDIIQIDGVDFIISQGARDDSTSIYTINDQNQMEIVQVIRDSSLLDAANDIEYVQIGSKHFILTTAFNSDRITAIEVGGSDDALVGTSDDDQMVGLNGDDDLIGMGGNDLMKGGAGADVLSGRAGNDTMYGDGGADVLVGASGNDVMEGGAGADFIIGGNGQDTAAYTSSSVKVNINLETGFIALGDAAGDVLSSIENLTGTDFNDTLRGTSERNVIEGGDGRDTIEGFEGNDVLNGGDGLDNISGGSGDDTIALGKGDDIGSGGGGADTINGGGGDDTINGNGGNDTINGSAGDDTINGGTGDDMLTGGSGEDVFVFATTDGGDTVTDFEDGVDQIDFSNHADFNSFGDVSAFAFQGNTIIGSGANSIVLEDFDIGDLNNADFIF